MRESEESMNISMIIIVIISAVSMIFLWVLHNKVLKKGIELENRHG